MSNWDETVGVVCPRCQQEVFWLRPADGICKSCTIAIAEKAERNKKREEAIARATERYGFRIRRKKKRAPGRLQVPSPDLK